MIDWLSKNKIAALQQMGCVGSHWQEWNQFALEAECFCEKLQTFTSNSKKFNQSCLLSLGSAANARKLIKTKLQWFDNCYQENVPLSRQLNVNINKQRNWLIHETNKRWAVQTSTKVKTAKWANVAVWFTAAHAETTQSAISFDIFS